MTTLLLIAAIAALIWGVVYLRYTGLWGCCLAVLVAGTVFGHAFFHISLATFDRALLAVGIGLWFVQRRFGMTQPKRLNAGDTLLSALLGILLVSTLMHDWRLDGFAPAARLVFYFLAPAAMYWLARQTAITPVRLRWAFGGFALLGIYLAVTSLAERYGIRWAVFPRYILTSPDTEFLGRGRGPLLNPCGNGVLLTLGMCSALMFLPSMNRVGKLGLIGLTLLFLAGLYGTLTRSVWIGGGLALTVVIGAAMPREWRVPTMAMSLLVALALCGLNWDRFQAFKRDKEVSVEEMRDSASLRPILATVAWQMFQDYPLFGCGYGQYREYSVDYLGDRTIDLPLEKVRPYIQHNVFLSLLTETGIVGAGLFVLLLVHWAGAAWRLWRCDNGALETRQAGLVFLAVLVAYAFNGMFHEVSIIPMVNMYVFFLAGVVRNLSEATAVERAIWFPTVRRHAFGGTR